MTEHICTCGHKSFGHENGTDECLAIGCGCEKAVEQISTPTDQHERETLANLIPLDLVHDRGREGFPQDAFEAADRILAAGFHRHPQPTEGEPSDALVRLSQWIDAGNAHRDPEAVTWGRLAKLAEEQGEVIEAFIGATGQNPRKGVTCSMEKVLEELLDVAVTALGAFEHIDGHQGRALSELAGKIVRVAQRAGVVADQGGENRE